MVEEASLESVLKRAQSVLQEEAIDINDKDFAEFYDPEKIRRDQQPVERSERKIWQQREANPTRKCYARLATIFEAIFHEQAELNQWLGPNVHTIRPSSYDDIENGIDSIAEFQEEPGRASHLALAVDVTYSEDMDVKFERIRKELEEGTLGTVEYFKSDFIHFVGRKRQVPRVIVGMDPDQIINLSETWMAKKNSELETHPAQILVLQEIKLQLEAYEQFCKKRGKTAAAQALGHSLALITEIKKEKDIPLGELENDKVFRSIKDYLGNFK